MEEKELIQRFRASYNEYRKSVPAFFVHPKNGASIFAFLPAGKIDMVSGITVDIKRFLVARFSGEAE